MRDNSGMRVLHAPTPCPDPIVTCRALTKIYGRGETAVRALDAVDVDFARGQFTAIMGPSGSGKSTLMHCLAGLDTASGGTVVLDSTTITGMSERQLTKMRCDTIGFIFQDFNLIPTLTARENIELPAMIARRPVSPERFDEIVDAVGIRDRLDHRPAEMSGGQQQRVACARALAANPTVIFADEPTGNLDSHASRAVLSFLRRAVDDFGQTVVMVTHDANAASWTDRVLFLVDGRVVGELTDTRRDTILDALRDLGDDDSRDGNTDAATPPTIMDRAVPEHSAAVHTAPELDLPTTTDEVVDRARSILDHLPGSVVPEDEAPLTAQIPIVRDDMNGAEDGREEMDATK